MSEDFIRTFLLPRVDQLEAEVKMLREVTWPVCQALRENGNPLSCSDEKRNYFKLLYKDDAMELLAKKAKFTGITNKVLLDAEFDNICTYSNNNKIEKKPNIDKICEYISSNYNDNIVLLRNKEVIQWLFGDLSFLPPIENKNKTLDELQYKLLEDTWGQNMLKIRRPDLKLDKQWTNKFGEHICEEIYTLLGKKISSPEIKDHYQPDLEIDDAIIEVKTGTFYTKGTAGEKILGCPFKYAEIPSLYGKPLKIMCVGGAEKMCREKYGNLPGVKCSVEKNKILDCFRAIGIEYIGATDILKSFSL